MPFSYGTYGHKIIEKYFENGKVVKEVVIKDDKLRFGEFIPNDPDNTSSE
jgi:hypothetical protein